MGQKVNPHGLRVGVIKDWDSRWYAEDKFADYLVKRNYTAQVFPKSRSREHLTELRSSSTQQNLVS